MNRVLACSLSLFAVAPVIVTVSAQQSSSSTQPAPTYCRDNPGFADFDFWVGEWNVYSNDQQAQLLGTNSISRHYENCLLKEQWTDAEGNGGFSVNYYNAVTREWRQVWVANGYSIDYTGGLDDDGAMVLEGKIYGYSAGTARRFRGAWTPQPDGTVIQRFDVYDADTGAWSQWFEGRYVRR